MMTVAPTASFWDAGEFIAVSHTLQVNHPPGAPFYSLLGRIFSMFSSPLAVAWSINLVSVLSSALTIMLLYLITIRLIIEWKGNPDQWSLSQKISLYGSCLIGAVTFSMTDTFWFNAVEAEVYALSSFFTAIVTWLILKWSEEHDQPQNERWLFLIAYMFGLAMGVHLLNLLCFFFISLIFYFKRWEFSIKSFLIMGILSVFLFFLLYPFTIINLPSILNFVNKLFGGFGSFLFLAIITFGIGYLIYYTKTRNKHLLHFILVCYGAVLMGYSSYAIIYIRSHANPPIDENNPETIEDLVYFLKREQYGSIPLLTGNSYNNQTQQIDQSKRVVFPRRYSPQANHLQSYANYSSDMDFFFRYQFIHMYIRYFNWNFIGRESDIQDTGWQSGLSPSPYDGRPDHNSYFYIPFLLGLIGAFYHFRKDWSRAFSIFVLFIVTGFAIIIFLNQTPLQPRERDYVYVGSFWSYAIWLSIGIFALCEMALKLFRKPIVSPIMITLMTGIPFLVGYQNWDDHDRSERYIAVDYAKNLLNSCAPNAILFTNGDNDTFPLWYAQEVEGVRRDVRIVCLSLLNTDWYIRQMRDNWIHLSPPLPITFSDSQIEQMSSALTPHISQKYTIEVDKQMLKNIYSQEEQYKKELGYTETNPEPIALGNPYGISIDELDNHISWRVQGRYIGKDAQGNNRYYLQTQDRIILDLLKNNQWKRPIYFATSTPPSSQLGLQNYFQLEGKAYLLTPKKMKNNNDPIYINEDIINERLQQFQFRNWNKDNQYYDENIRRMFTSYHYMFVQYVRFLISQNQLQEAKDWMSFVEKSIHLPADDPNSLLLLINYAYFYTEISDSARAIQKVETIKNIASDGTRKWAERRKIKIDNYNQLVQQVNDARQKANFSEVQRLRTRLQQNQNSINNHNQSLQQYHSAFIILQWIYFYLGKDELAIDLSEQVTLLSQQAINLPKTKEESDDLFNQTGLRIQY